MIEIVKRLLASPLAGVYSFLVLFILATMTGELDPLQYLYTRIFPDENSIGIESVTLHPILEKPSRPMAPSNNEALLFLVRHDRNALSALDLLQFGGYSVPRLMLGSVSGTAVPQGSGGVVSEPLRILSVKLPPKALMAVALDQPRRRYMLSAGVLERDLRNSGGLVLKTQNEMLGMRILYGFSILLAGGVGLSLPKFRKLRYPEEPAS